VTPRTGDLFGPAAPAENAAFSGPRRLVIPGPPVPKARARTVRGHSYTPARTAAAEKAIKALALAAGWTPLDGPVAVTLHFYVPDRRRRDIDNLTKLVLDALNGIAWHDDSQIRCLVARRSHTPDSPRTDVDVCAVPEERT